MAQQPLTYPIAFTKMSGTGNDFILIDHREPFIPQDTIATFVKQVCRRKFSAGADGLILIENSQKEDFAWQFFNADGSVAEMCGNGARCAARFAYHKGIAPARMRFTTVAGVIEAEMVGDAVKVKLTSPSDLRETRELLVDNEKIQVSFINTGVPHVVCFVDDISATPVIDLGRKIRNHSEYQPAGTNVNFVQVTSQGLIVRTYERGVEDETQACGTGAVASALIAAMTGKNTLSPVQVTTSGGDQLIIHHELNQSEVVAVYLEGPANFIYEGSLSVESI